MRNSISVKILLLLAIMLFLIIRPVLPIIEYALNKEYIEKNLCEKRNVANNNCHGMCHVKAQTASCCEQDKIGTQNNASSTKKHTVLKTVNDDFLHEILAASNLACSQKSFFYTYRDLIFHRNHSCIFVPPEV